MDEVRNRREVGTGEKGQGLVEYGLMLLFIAAAVALTLGAFGVALEAYYDAILAGSGLPVPGIPPA